MVSAIGQDRVTEDAFNLGADYYIMKPFENDVVIFEILNAAVKEAIGEGAFIPSIDFDTEGAPEIPVVPHNTTACIPASI